MNKSSENDYKSIITPNSSFKGLFLYVTWFRRLSIAKKIGLGYAIAIGVSVLGTITGTLIGDYYQYRAVLKERTVDEEVELFNEFKSSILQARIHQQRFIALLEKPKDLQKEYTSFLKQKSEAEESWNELELFSQEIISESPGDSKAISNLLKTYEGVPETYFQQVNKLIKQIGTENLQSPEEIQAAQKLLLDFTNSSLALKLDEISDELSELAEAAEEGDEESDLALVKAQKTRRLIIIGTNLTSILLAILLSIYTTKAIALPIKNLTDIAEETTQKSNFDLEASVTTDDEVG